MNDKTIKKAYKRLFNILLELHPINQQADVADKYCKIISVIHQPSLTTKVSSDVTN